MAWKNPFSMISKRIGSLLNLVKESVLDNSTVSSLRIQAYMAFIAVYGVWVITNLTILIIAIVDYYTKTGTTFTFDFKGWVEIISLTGGMIIGRVWQSSNENKKV